MVTQRELAESLDSGVLTLVGDERRRGPSGPEGVRVVGAKPLPSGRVDRAALRARGLTRKQIEAAGKRARRQLKAAVAESDAAARRCYQEWRRRLDDGPA